MVQKGAWMYYPKKQARLWGEKKEEFKL